MTLPPGSRIESEADSMWFERLAGCVEESPDQVRQQLFMRGETLVSKANDKEYSAGTLEIPSLAELRLRVDAAHVAPGKLRLEELVADVTQLHKDEANAGAFFQVASQFNLLEMVSPSVTPEQGVDRYEFDHTQGPACAIACGAGTIYRNYFADVDGLPGQSEHRQIDCLADLGKSLGNEQGQLWTMRNGYALATEEGLAVISDQLAVADEAARDALRSRLRIGIQWNTQVTLDNCEHSVTQAYCSALPVAYSDHSPGLWEPFARLVLEASYEATLLAAVLNSAATGSDRVFLTLLGGGAFGNHNDWILSAISRALNVVADRQLEVAIVSYGRPNAQVAILVAERGWEH